LLTSQHRCCGTAIKAYTAAAAATNAATAAAAIAAAAAAIAAAAATGVACCLVQTTLALLVTTDLKVLATLQQEQHPAQHSIAQHGPPDVSTCWLATIQLQPTPRRFPNNREQQQITLQV
jgi:hypothetical protein